MNCYLLKSKLYSVFILNSLNLPAGLLLALVGDLFTLVPNCEIRGRVESEVNRLAIELAVFIFGA